MPAVTRDIVESIYEAWAARDLAGTVAHFDADTVYCLHVPPGVLPHGGTHVGRDAIEAALRRFLDAYGFFAYAVDRVVVDDAEIVRAQVIYYFQHTESGVQIDGRFRHVWHIVDRRVARLDEYHDVAMLKAFLEMVRSLRGT